MNNASFSQEIPPVVNFSSDIYVGGGNQNWMLTQDENHFIYAANNEGLLEYNGSIWKLYPSPNESIIRAVKAIDNRIYTGCYMEFGFWERLSDGNLKYHSLSNKIKDKLIEDEHIWNIINLDQWILFQSFNRIYIYDSKLESFKLIDNHNIIFKCFNVNNSIYYQAIGEGLFEIIDGKSQLVNDDEIVKKNRIVLILSQNNELLLQTERAGIYKLNNKKLQPFHFASEAELSKNMIYTSQKLSDGGYAIGTISNGIYILDKTGLIKYHITQNKGLNNNTVLAIFEDFDHNLWLGLDNGIDCINLQSPIKYFKDDDGYLGTVYTSIMYRDKIYLGTNQGLYYRDNAQNNEFKFINGTKGQVWNLFEYDNILFCGHDLGTFIIEGEKIKLIYNDSGTWKFNKHSSNENILLQGNYTGISVLEKINGNWVFRNKIKGFDISSRYFEISDNQEIYVGHEYKGIIKVIPTKDFKSVQKYSTLKNPEKGKHLSLVKFKETIYFAGKQGIFRLNNKTNEFELDANLSEVFKNDEYISGKLNVDNSNKMWLFTKNYIYVFTSGSFSNQLKIQKLPIPFSFINAMLSYENITQISSNEYLIGKTDGYFIIDLNNFKVKNHNIILTNVSVNKLENSALNLPISEKGNLNHDENNITFNYSVPQFNRFISIKYQYLLEGYQNQWSEWSTKTNINFKNLAPGDYTFKVRAKLANELPQNEVIYIFTINKPWYFTNISIFIYGLIALAIAYFSHKIYLKKYYIQREKLIEENNRLLEIKELENEQQLMKIRNEQLTHDVDLKNRELAVSTISLLKKNELLTLIKEDLKKTTEDKNKDFKSVITKINRNITEEDSWNIFREAYDNLDQDFLKKMKDIHPSLTPNDLKLCAYLRLNLSSKEIAPMLHISTRSMEIKRYRLRKKLDLKHDESLVNYILSI